MTWQKKITEAAIAEIISAQQSDGSFLSLSSTRSDFEDPRQYSTTFFTSLILAATPEVPELAEARNKAVAFLLGQANEQGAFNYWSRSSPEFTFKPYPDDLDDTFCAWGALTVANPGLISGPVLAKLVQLLTAVETKPGGPYRTWLVGSEALEQWQDIDLAVNANIGWFLAMQKVRVPGLLEFIEHKIQAEDYASPYYPTPYPIIYFLSRWYRGHEKNKVVKFLLDRKGAWGNQTDSLLAIIALLNFGEDTASVELLLEKYARQDFEAAAFCLDPVQNGQTAFAGCRALSAALVLQALWLWESKPQLQPQLPPEDQKIYGTIVNQVQKRLATLPEPLKTQALLRLEKTLQADKRREITLLPYFFHQALKIRSVPEEKITLLGEANLYGWIAYTIYDNIMDDQTDLELLPAANFCARQVSSIYTAELPPDFAPWFQKIVDGIDAANAWELGNTRSQTGIPDYGDFSVLADRSLGHALGSLAILWFSDQARKAEIILQFFHHYLIARQLNDDAHDWAQDLAQGQINSVAALLMKDWQAEHREPFTVAELQELFWRKTINKVGLLIHLHALLARQAWQESGLFNDDALVDRIIQPLQQAASAAESETKKTKEFIAAYGILKP